MAQEANGHKVRIRIECEAPDGTMMSDAGSGGWYGFRSEYEMNIAAASIVRAIVEEVGRWNEEKYGPNKKAQPQR